MIILRFSLAFLGLVFLVITEVGREIYRPWVYENSVQDFGIADSIGSLGGAFVVVFLVSAIVGKTPKKLGSAAFGAATGCPIYEILQPYLNTGVFDWRDLIASMMAAYLAAIAARAACNIPQINRCLVDT